MLRPVDAPQARRALRDKGFVESAKRDHEMYFLYIDGKKTDFWVKISHGAKEIRKDEIALNARSIGMKGQDLYLILACTHDAKATRELYLATNT